MSFRFVSPIVIVISAIISIINFKNSDFVQDIIHAKGLAVFGFKGVGKTTLIEYLQTPNKNPKTDATMKPANIKKFTSKIDKYNNALIRLKASTDVPGSSKDEIIALDEWKRLCQKSGIIIYIVRVDLIINKSSKEKKIIERDLKEIVEWVQRKNKTIIIVGNYWKDHDERSYKKFIAKPEEFLQSFESCIDSFLEEARGKLKNDIKIFLGSLENKKDAKELVDQIKESIYEHNKYNIL